ncbi:MAG: LPP20 family lipoprotein [Cyclobacteriaceae bacterium]|nr:LPP20 family lipoprotein [Cyclobacteriaceae bacterium]
MKTNFFIFFFLTLIFSCRSTQNQTTVEQPSLSKGEEEVIIPCSGPEYFTDGEVFRANSIGESIDLSVSKRKAMTNARSQLAASIQTTVRMVTDNYVKSTENNNQEEIEERFESLNREVVSQELRGIRKICERYYRTTEGKYRTYVAIELSAQELVDAYYQRLQNSASLTIDFNYEKFKKALETEMLQNRQEKE